MTVPRPNFILKSLFMTWKGRYFFFLYFAKSHLLNFCLYIVYIRDSVWLARHHNYLLKLIYCSFMESNSSLFDTAIRVVATLLVL